MTLSRHSIARRNRIPMRASPAPIPRAPTPFRGACTAHTHARVDTARRGRRRTGDSATEHEWIDANDDALFHEAIRQLRCRRPLPL